MSSNFSERFAPTIINNYNPMALDEIRTFRIDKELKPNCGLLEKDIKIRKQRAIYTTTNPEGYHFNMVGHERDVSIECEPGFVSHFEVKGPAQGCGIGKMLMKLCFNEEKIHNVANKDKNFAVGQLEELKNEMERFGDGNLATEVQKWVGSHCSKLLYLVMSAKPKTAAHVYFNSAMDSKYTYMFIDKDSEEYYPKEGPCPVETLKDQYNEKGEMVNGKHVVRAHGQGWFFCHPKTFSGSTTSKCIIL